MSEEKELFKAGTESGFIFQLDSDKTSFNLETGKLNLEGAEMKYFDEEGNEITKEQFNEFRIKRLEEKMDRVLELLEGKELSISCNALEIGKLSDLPDAVVKRNNLGNYAKN